MKALLTLGEVLAAVLVLEGAAQACGGTFCDSGPQSMPVDQTGENILFVMDGQSVEAHIQINYTGAAAKFAWVIPMPTVPTASVGSEALFMDLGLATAARYGYSTNSECQAVCGDGGTSCSSSSCGDGGDGSGDGGGVHVDYQATVGAFTVTALSGGTAKEVSDWLKTNGYASPASAPKLLQTYVDKSYVFVAVKLTGETGVDQIHPLVLKYPGNMPCIPLVLTALAARDNMGIRAFFLADHRVYPENWKLVELNTVRLDWLSLAKNYDQAIANAVHEAQGHGWITEYAGPSLITTNDGRIWSPSWDATPFQTIAPEAVVNQLKVQGLASCGPSRCRWKHTLLLGLLHQYLPPPAGVSDDAWYSDLPGQVAQIDMTAWSATGFAADFDTRIVQPGLHVADVFSAHQYLTEMFTRISPPQMTEDPTFQLRPDLDADRPHIHMATYDTDCDGPVDMKLPVSDRTIELHHKAQWPVFSSKMPWAEKIYRIPPNGPPVVVVDNTEKIDDLLHPSKDQSDSGCGCRAAPAAPGWIGVLLSVGFAGLWARLLRRPRAR